MIIQRRSSAKCARPALKFIRTANGRRLHNNKIMMTSHATELRPMRYRCGDILADMQ